MNKRLAGTISFDKSLIPNILEAFGNKLDKEEYILDKTSGEKVISPDGDYVHVSEFAGIAKGSRVYVKSDIGSLINFVEKEK